MSQHRNTAIPEERILDAAYKLVLAVGMRRVTMAELARAADVSRATLYRRFPNVDAVVAALTTRELAAISEAAFARPGKDTRSTVVSGIVATVRAVRTHPLTRKIVDVDPEFRSAVEQSIGKGRWLHRDQASLEFAALVKRDDVAAVNDAGRARGLSANDLLREAAAAVDGKGGGKDDVAQGGGTNPAGIPDALARAEHLVGRVATS